MSLLQNLTDGGEKPRGILNGRGNRREFWIWVVGTVIAGGVFTLVLHDAYVGLTLSGWVMLIGYIRRFHDLGLSGWWAVAMRVGQTLLAAFAMAVLGAAAGAWISVLLLVAPILVLGCLPGDAKSNEFG